MNKNLQFLVSIFCLNLLFLPIWYYVRLSAQKKTSKKIVIFEKVWLLIFTEYLICLTAVTIIPLPFSKMGSPYLNLDLFHQTYNNFLSAYNHTSNRTVFDEIENLLGNIVLFFPFGFILPLLSVGFRNFIRLALSAALCSLLIEAVQYFISVNWGYNRIADVDDLVLNIIGAILGFIVFRIFKYFGIFKIAK